MRSNRAFPIPLRRHHFKVEAEHNDLQGLGSRAACLHGDHSPVVGALPDTVGIGVGKLAIIKLHRCAHP